ncbi:MAG TPA: ATP-binding protein [Planctomycetota bacterium]|nr:ATP-binding protein [Planctomycetota bacterium]
MTSLAGWVADIPRLADWGNDGIHIQPNSALAVIFAGLALYCYARSRERASAVLGVLTACLGASALFENLSDIDLGIDRIFLFGRSWGQTSTVSPGRMGVPGATSWTLLGIGVLLLHTKARRLSPTLGLIASMVALLSIIGYAYSAAELYSLPEYTAIALQTAIMIFLLGLGLMTSAPEQGIVAMFVRQDAGGVLMRRLLPLTIALILLLGWLRVRGQHLGLFGTASGTALFVFSTIVILTLLLMATSGKVSEAAQELLATMRSQKLLGDIAELSASSKETGPFIEAIGERVARAFGVSRCGFSRVDVEQGQLVVEHDYHGSFPSIAGVYAIADYAPRQLSDALAGRPTVVDDLPVEVAAGGSPERIEALRVRSSISVHLHRDGKWVANFWITSHEPRSWTEAEIERMRSIADRVWLFIEKSRAVDQQRAALESLAESEQLLRTVTDYARVGLVIVDTDHRYRYSNRAYSEVLQLPSHEIVGRHVGDVLGEAYTSQIRPWLDLAFRGEAVNHELLLPPRPGANDPRCFSMTYQPQTKLGRVTSVVVAVTDISQRRQDEEKLREADRRKDEFLATLSHELRNPLAPIRNSLELLKGSGKNDELVEQMRSTADRHLTHLVRIVDDLLDVSRITRDKIELRSESVDLGSLARQVVDAHRPQLAAAGLEMQLDLPSTPIWLDGDVVRLTQVLDNLLSNACKYTRRGGHVRLRLEAQGSDALLSVADDGVGIPKEMLTSIFDMFRQVDQSLMRAQGGLGIGLTLVKKLVEMHGGSVSAESDGPGRGSCFEVRLPRRLEAPTSAAAAPKAPQEAVPGRRILVVDDHEDSARTLAALLQLSGCETATAEDGLEAIEKAESFDPQVILLDIGLPKLNGYDACRAIRAQPHGPGIVMIALTGWGQEEDRLKSRDAGFDGHLVKPVEHAQLMHMLAELGTR